MPAELAHNEKMVFAISVPPDGIPVLMIGVPLPAWKFIRDGKTCHFDLSKAGMKLRVLVYGGANQFLCMKALSAAMEESGMAYLDERMKDWGVKTGHEGEPDITTEKLPEAMTREEAILAIKSLRNVVANMEANRQDDAGAAA